MKFDLIAFLDGILSLVSKARGKAKSDIRSTSVEQAYKGFDNIVGRFDVPQKLARRDLYNVQDDDRDDVRALGAVYDEQTKQWNVPETITDLTRFELWWHPVPEDVRDSEPRLVMTKTGRRIEGYVLGEDIWKGADSISTSIMYGALPVVAALSYALTALWSPLGILSLLLAVPFLVAITQGEGIKEGMKSAVLLLLIPAFGSQYLASFSMMTAALTSGIPIIGIGGGSFASMLGLGAILSVLVFLWNWILPDKEKVVMGGFFERLKHALKFGALFAAIIVLVGFMPAYMAPAALLMLACLYSMQYTEHNFVVRSQELKENGERFNLGTQGALTSAHVGARHKQCENAFKDKTPLIYIGQAVGHLTKKHYAYAPDEGKAMALSCLDFTMHFFGFGATGSGKTSNMARPIILQYKKSKFGGALIRCGKGTLPGELRSMIDIMIEPGVDFAPYEGLDAKELTNALNSLQSADEDPRSAIWINGADNVVDHSSVLLEALVKHEIHYKNHAIKKARDLEEQVSQNQVKLAKLRQQQVDTTHQEELLSELMKHLTNWAIMRDEPRRYKYTPDGHLKLLYAVNALSMTKAGPGPSEEMSVMAEFLGYGAPEKRDPETIHRDLNSNSQLDDSLNFFLHAWPKIEDGQRSSFMINVLDRIIPLVRGRDLRNKEGQPWSQMETGVDISQALYGKFVGINLPVNQHGRAAKIIAALARQRIYSGIRKRQDFGELWQENLPGQMPVMDLCDECQLIVSKEELDMAPIARSLGLMMVMLTQGFENLVNTFGSLTKADQFCNQFQSVGTMFTSNATYEYLMKRFGTALMVKFEQPAMGLDYQGGLMNALHSPLNDIDHPNRSAMRKIERLGAGRFEVADNTTDALEWHGHRARRKSDMAISKSIKMPVGGKKEIQPVFLPEEYSALLTEQGRAILWLKRAGVPRVDVAQLNYVSEKEVREAKFDDVEDVSEAA